MLDRSKDCCTLHLKNREDEKELKQEYLRLKIENKNNPACCTYSPGGLHQLMRIMAKTIGIGVAPNHVTNLFGSLDVDLTYLPEELHYLMDNPLFQKDIRFWSFQMRPDFYLYFVIADNKVLHTDWYFQPKK